MIVNSIIQTTHTHTHTPVTGVISNKLMRIQINGRLPHYVHTVYSSLTVLNLEQQFYSMKTYYDTGLCIKCYVTSAVTCRHKSVSL